MSVTLQKCQVPETFEKKALGATPVAALPLELSCSKKTDL